MLEGENIMRKNRVVLPLLLTLSMVLSGCSAPAKTQTTAAPVSTTSAAADAGQEAQPQKKYKIICIQRMAGASYWDTLAKGCSQAGEDLGQEVINMSPTESDAAAQIAVLQDAIALQPDAITIVPVSNDALEPLLKQAMDQGIVVITGEGVGMTNHDWDLAGLNTENYANHAIDELAKAMGEEGDYALMAGSLTNSGHMSRLEAMKKRQEELYPNMHLVSGEIIAPTAGTADSALALFKELIVTYPDLKGIFTHEKTAQAALAVEEAGKLDQITVMGYATPNEAGQYLASGAITLSIVGDTIAKGAATVALAVKVLDGEEVVEGMDLGYTGFDSIIVDKENKSVEANSFIDINKDNYMDFDF